MIRDGDGSAKGSKGGGWEEEEDAGAGFGGLGFEASAGEKRSWNWERGDRQAFGSYRTWGLATRLTGMELTCTMAACVG